MGGRCIEGSGEARRGQTVVQGPAGCRRTSEASLGSWGCAGLRAGGRTELSAHSALWWPLRAGQVIHLELGLHRLLLQPHQQRIPNPCLHLTTMRHRKGERLAQGHTARNSKAGPVLSAPTDSAVTGGGWRAAVAQGEQSGRGRQWPSELQGTLAADGCTGGERTLWGRRRAAQRPWGRSYTGQGWQAGRRLGAHRHLCLARGSRTPTLPLMT